MSDKLKQIARVLLSLPEEQRLALILQLLPDTHAVITRRCQIHVAHSFRDTAQRVHGVLKTELRFDPRAIPQVWMAMMESASVRPRPLR
jgi:hypothetical protein